LRRIESINQSINQSSEERNDILEWAMKKMVRDTKICEITAISYVIASLGMFCTTMYSANVTIKYSDDSDPNTFLTSYPGR